MVKGLAAVTQDAICGAYLFMGGEDKQQHDKGADVSGDCRGYGGSVVPICNMNLDDLNTLHVLDELESRNDLTNRPNLERLHVPDDLQELDGGKGKAEPPPVKMEIKDGNRRFNAALERGEIP